MKKLPKKSGLPQTYVRGQALLIVLLSMSVVLTVVLSVVSKSVTDISTTSKSEDSVRAFSAAEAGIEQAIVAGPGDYGSGSDFAQSSSTFAAHAAVYPVNSTTFVIPSNLFSGETATVWLNSHDAQGRLSANPSTFNGNLTFCWGKAGYSDASATTPAVEISIYYKVGAEVRIYRAAIDPYTGRQGSDSFASPDTAPPCLISGQTFAFQKMINTTTLTNMQFASIRILYNTDTNQPVGVISSGSNFPGQGMSIDSRGVSGISSRRVQVLQGYPEAPVPFTAAVFSQGGITQ